MVKLWARFGAGRKVELPPCEATIVHVPLATALTVPDETVQTLGVLLVIETVKPELAVAVTTCGVEFTIAVFICESEMD